jgi:hypothetical protein
MSQLRTVISLESRRERSRGSWELRRLLLEKLLDVFKGSADRGFPPVNDDRSFDQFRVRGERCDPFSIGKFFANQAEFLFRALGSIKSGAKSR